MSERKLIINAGAVIIENNKILLVQEAEAPFTGKWNFPLGQIESDELISDTVKREVKEETGYDIKLTYFLGVYQSLSQPRVNVVIVMFKAKPIDGKLEFDKKELLQSKWFDLKEFNNLSDNQLFHPEMRRVVTKALENPQPLTSYILF